MDPRQKASVHVAIAHFLKEKWDCNCPACSALRFAPQRTSQTDLIALMIILGECNDDLERVNPEVKRTLGYSNKQAIEILSRKLMRLPQHMENLRMARINQLEEPATVLMASMSIRNKGAHWLQRQH